jgi:dTDP-4-dehydrorhamnose reductase
MKSKTSAKRVLVTGASGMLGKDFISLFSESGGYDIYTNQIDHEEILKDRDINSLTFDLTDTSLFAGYLKEIQPDLIIHCAAIVNVDRCENDKDHALRLHCETVNQIALHAVSAKLVYISTDSVFDGTKGNYQESDQTNPLNYYAKSKLLGEENTLKLLKNSMVVRTNIYGFHLQENKPSLAEWALSSLQKNKSINGFTDVFFNPVYTKQLAVEVLKLINLNFNGLIHVASGTFLSKYIFLTELARTFGYNPDLIRKESIDTMHFSAKRPNNTTLNTNLVAKTLGSVPDFTEGMKQFHLDYQNLKRLNGQTL